MIWNINKLDVCSALRNFKGTKVYILVLSKQFDEQGALLFSQGPLLRRLINNIEKAVKIQS